MRQGIFSALERWAAENINAEGYEPEDGDNPLARAKAAEFIVVASASGIPVAELREVRDEIVGYLASEIERANNAEVDRLVRKDKT
jgi:hypothetical protein